MALNSLLCIVCADVPLRYCSLTHQKGKTNLDILDQDTVSGSGIRPISTKFLKLLLTIYLTKLQKLFKNLALALRVMALALRFLPLALALMHWF